MSPSLEYFDILESEHMFIQSFPAGPWQTNCYIVAPSRSSECIIIDPGYQVREQVAEIVHEANLKPVAVLMTHGHLDHMWSVFPISSGYEIPALIHKNDRHLLSDPAAGISAETIAMLETTLNVDSRFIEPADVIEFEAEQEIEIAGMTISVVHAPGHTSGSVLFRMPSAEPVVFTGDVLFAGAIGRTDLPGGSSVQMNETLREKILPIGDEWIVHPGHGPSSTMQQERVNNPYLLRIAQGLNAV